jgi:hypothetical protein
MKSKSKKTFVLLSITTALTVATQIYVLLRSDMDWFTAILLLVSTLSAVGMAYFSGVYNTWAKIK